MLARIRLRRIFFLSALVTRCRPPLFPLFLLFPVIYDQAGTAPPLPFPFSPLTAFWRNLYIPYTQKRSVSILTHSFSISLFCHRQIPSALVADTLNLILCLRNIIRMIGCPEFLGNRRPVLRVFSLPAHSAFCGFRGHHEKN